MEFHGRDPLIPCPDYFTNPGNRTKQVCYRSLQHQAPARDSMPLLPAVTASGLLGASSNPNPTPNNYAPDPTASISVNENYIYSCTYLAPLLFLRSFCPQQQSISYFDGLWQTQAGAFIKSTPNGNDLVTDIPYDSFERQVQSWLSGSDEHSKWKYSIRSSDTLLVITKADGSTDPFAYGEKTLKTLLGQSSPRSGCSGF